MQQFMPFVDPQLMPKRYHFRRRKRILKKTEKRQQFSLMLYFNRCNVIFSLYLCMRYVFVHSYLAFFLYIHILHFSCSVL